MKLIEVLFNHLVLQRPAGWHQKKWLPGYRKIIDDISIVRNNLLSQENLTLVDDEIYVKTPFKNYEGFLHKLIWEKSNGVSSKGQSVISHEKFGILVNDTNFREAIERLVKEPNEEKNAKLKQSWDDVFSGEKTYNRPVLLNRVVAACNQNLSTIVDVNKFNVVYNFLKRECDYEPITESQSWFDKNIELIDWLRNELSEMMKSYEADDINKNLRLNIFVWELYTLNTAMFDLKKSVVKYGAPGTGKTYGCKEDAAQHFDYWKVVNRPDYSVDAGQHQEVVQFHPSYTYEDFIEGIKPFIKDGKTQLKLTNGIFKEFCKKAAKWEIHVYKAFPELRKEICNPKTKKVWEDIEVQEVRGKLQDDSCWNFLEKAKDTDKIANLIPPFYFIIDEINRAEISRVMGELMYCLEYRGIEGKTKTQYGNLTTNIEQETAFFFEDEQNFFFIPHNIYLLATMNTIDRSVESFDFALRRRFIWQEVGVDYDSLEDYCSDKADNRDFSDLIVGLKSLNESIIKDPLLGSDFQIGHAYFMNLPKHFYLMKMTDFKATIWNKNIKPLLEEYLRGSGDTGIKINQFWDEFIKPNKK